MHGGVKAAFDCSVGLSHTDAPGAAVPRRWLSIQPQSVPPQEPWRSGDAQTRLSDDYAAGNPGPGVAGGVGLPVVGFRVDNKGRATLMKQRLWPFSKRHPRNQNSDVGFSVRTHVQVLQIAQVMA